jgi:rSAM/selenodomain-associated transferase 2
MSQFNLSIIVPVYNEADQLEKLIRRLRLFGDGLVKDVIVVDGGSTDGTPEKLAQEFFVIKSNKGRANQMNAGAKVASGTWLLFLHADTELTSGHISTAISEGALYKWGRFDVKLSGKKWAYRIIEWFINTRSRLTSVATGDQCIFVRKSVFDDVGGFDDMPLMEDVAICKKLRKVSKPACVEKTVTTSSRRWDEKGTIKTVFLMWKLRFYYWCGVSPDRLAKMYR